ncbi:MAG: JAB domain-containing protein [Pseudomonadota bacterium]
MKEILQMTRAELVAELIAAPVAVVTDASATYASTATGSNLDALIAYKLAVASAFLLSDWSASTQDRPVLNSPTTVRDWLKLHFAPLGQEVFIVLYLDVGNRLIAVEEMFRGEPEHTRIDARAVVKSALAHNAAGVLLARNHPFGEKEPSAADLVITRELVYVLFQVDVRVADYFILADDQIISLAEEGKL